MYFECPELLGKVPQRCCLDLPEVFFGLVCGIGPVVLLGRHDVHVPMSGDPQDEIRIGVKNGQQLQVCDHAGAGEQLVVAGCGVEGLLGVERDVRRNDHQFVPVLAVLQFGLEPVEAGLVEAGPGVLGLVGALHGVVEGDDLDRHVRFRLEAVARKIGVEVGLFEAVTGGIRGGFKELAHPVQGG